jgi:hypothetical protein
MKSGVVLCILFLVIAGAVSAATINTAMIKPADRQLVVAAAPNSAAVTFNSSVQGATVYLDGGFAGSDETHSKTPVTASRVTAGNHIATFRLSGYEDFISTFTVEAGKPQTIFAQLQPAIARAAANKNSVQPALAGQQAAPVDTTPVITHVAAVDSVINMAASGIFGLFNPAPAAGAKSDSRLADAAVQLRNTPPTVTSATPGVTVQPVCKSDRECNSTGNCVDGVCCDTKCEGNCHYCAFPGHVGTCMDVPDAQDPRRACQLSQGGTASCGGACYSGQCAFPDVGTPCGICEACDGTGRCTATPSDDSRCGVIQCSGLDTSCRIYHDLISDRCAALGACKSDNDPMTCDYYTNLPCK